MLNLQQNDFRLPLSAVKFTKVDSLDSLHAACTIVIRVLALLPFSVIIVLVVQVFFMTNILEYSRHECQDEEEIFRKFPGMGLRQNPLHGTNV